MKKAKLYLSLLLALVLVAGSFSSVRVHAADNDAFSVKVEETETGVVLKIVAEKALTFGGIQFKVSFDETVFTYDSVTSPLDITEGPNGFLGDAGNTVGVNAGESVVELKYTAQDLASFI